MSHAVNNTVANGRVSPPGYLENQIDFPKVAIRPNCRSFQTHRDDNQSPLSTSQRVSPISTSKMAPNMVKNLASLPGQSRSVAITSHMVLQHRRGLPRSERVSRRFPHPIWLPIWMPPPIASKTIQISTNHLIPVHYNHPHNLGKGFAHI